MVQILIPTHNVTDYIYIYNLVIMCNRRGVSATVSCLKPDGGGHYPRRSSADTFAWWTHHSIITDF